MRPIAPTLAFVLLAAGCGGKTDPVDTDTDAADTDSPDTDVAAVCGDGVVQEGEGCDLGEANGPDANCLADCTSNPVQTIVAIGGDVIDDAKVDAVGLADGDAPAGTGAWTPSDTDLGGDSLVKFMLYIPLFDFRSEIDPQTLQQLGAAPWVPPADWDLGNIPLSQLDEISFWTKTPAGEPRTPFYLVLYTQADGVEDDGWYGRRLLAEPYLARAVDAPDDTWVKWSVRASTNQLTFIDADTTGSFGASGQPILADLQDGAGFNWSTVSASFPDGAIDYGTEIMRYVSIQTASGEATSGTDARLDLIEVSLKDGRKIVVDLEP